MTAVSAIYRPAAREVMLTTAAGSVAFPADRAQLLRESFERLDCWLYHSRAVATVTLANAAGERLVIAGDELPWLAVAIEDAFATRDIAISMASAS